MKRLIAIAAAVGIGFTGVGTAASAANRPHPAGPSPISWTPCSGDLGKTGTVCGTISVPLDYAHPNGAKIQLAVSKYPHKSKHYQGIMLSDPGGPGGSGIALGASLAPAVPRHVGDDYDWISFDPRGVGASRPLARCLSSAVYYGYDRPNYVPSTPTLEKTWLTRNAGYDKACAHNSSHALLEHMSTADNARDLDSIRKALGAKQINYYGFSWGTYLGQVYATLYPTHLRRLILDSNVDPRGVWYPLMLHQATAFDRVSKIYFGWLAQHNAVLHLGATEAAVSKLWYTERDQLGRHPADGKIGSDEWTDAFTMATYNVFGWADLGKAFSGWVHKHDAASLAVIDKYYQHANNPIGQPDFYAAYNAVTCDDTSWPHDWSTWRHDIDRVNRRAPFSTWQGMWQNAPCLNWPVKPQKPVRINGSKIHGALLFDEENDAATPFEGDLYIRSIFPSSRLIAAPGGTSHTASLYGVSCVDDQIADYLATGKLPARKPGPGPDSLCPALAPPPLTSSSTTTQNLPLPMVR